MHQFGGVIALVFFGFCFAHWFFLLYSEKVNSEQWHLYFYIISVMRNRNLRAKPSIPKPSSLLFCFNTPREGGLLGIGIGNMNYGGCIVERERSPIDNSAWTTADVAAVTRVQQQNEGDPDLAVTLNLDEPKWVTGHGLSLT